MPSEPRTLDDGGRALLRECPFQQFVPKKPATRVVLARLSRIKLMTLAGYVHGRILIRREDGWNMEITLTSAGRVALGLPPEPPAP